MTEDLRQERTRTSLGNALVRMLSTADIADISVTALCREAGVHRTTFYGHANSIEEFAVALLTQSIDEVTTVSPTDERERMPDRYAAATVDLLRHVADERVVFRALLGSRWGGALRAALEERMRARVRLALDVFVTTGVPDVPADLDEVAAFVSGALVGTISWWAASDDHDADAAAERLFALMPPWWPVTRLGQGASATDASQRR